MEGWSDLLRFEGPADRRAEPVSSGLDTQYGKSLGVGADRRIRRGRSCKAEEVITTYRRVSGGNCRGALWAPVFRIQQNAGGHRPPLQLRHQSD